MKDFGKDHWSLLAYVECRCVDNKGVPDGDHMRTNPNRHLGVNRPRANRFCEQKWKPEYGTRLVGYFLEGDKRDKSRQIKSHDDWDCFEDLEAAGFVKNIGSGINQLWELTPHGIFVAAQLRAHKAAGKHFATFKPISQKEIQP